MIETLILGFCLGFIATIAGAAYAAYREFHKPYMIKSLSNGYEVVALDKGIDNDPNYYIAIRKNGKIIGAVRFDDKGEYDIAI